MTVIIAHQASTVFDTAASDIQDGMAYMDGAGEVYIGNRVQGGVGTYIVAFGISGDSIIYSDCELQYRKITLTCSIS
jgi:hypothetical protein